MSTKFEVVSKLIEDFAKSDQVKRDYLGSSKSNYWMSSSKSIYWKVSFYCTSNYYITYSHLARGALVVIFNLSEKGEMLGSWASSHILSEPYKHMDIVCNEVMLQNMYSYLKAGNYFSVTANPVKN